jgi:hypothetical protein
VAVLFEEHPVKHLRAIPGTLGLQRRAFAEMEQDGAGFRQQAPSSNSSSGTRPLGLSLKNSGLRVEPSCNP